MFSVWLSRGKERAGAFAIGFPHLPPISLELSLKRPVKHESEREYCLRTGNERINPLLLVLSIGWNLFAGLGSGYSLCKPESPWQDVRGKSRKPKYMFLPADASTGRSPSVWEKSAGKIPEFGFAGKAEAGLEAELSPRGSDVWGRLQSSPGFVISFDFEQKITEEGLGGEEG